MSAFFESLKVALDMLRLYKLRAFLTMLGVIIGVMSVTMIVMVKNGFQHYMTGQIEKMGTRTLMIMYDPGGRMRGQSVGAIGGLKTEDVEYLRDRVPSIAIFSPILQVPTEKIVYLDRSVDGPRVYATDDQQSQLSKIDMKSGRFLSSADIDARANVCLVGEEISDKLFGKQDPIGKLVTFKGITLEVVGVMAKVEIMGQSNGKDVWMPITTAQAK